MCVFVENSACCKLVQSVLGSRCIRLMNFFTCKIRDLMMHKRAHKEEEERRGARGRDEERSNQEEWMSKEEGEKEID